MKRFLLISVLCMMASSMQAQNQTVPEGYVDLGLPSGTLWKASNESGFYGYNDAVKKFGSRLPTKDQWLELKIWCTWIWTGSGYKISGDNGEVMYLSASGERDCGGSFMEEGDGGYYWSSTPYENYEEHFSWRLYFKSDRYGISHYGQCFGSSVRLVHD